MTLTSNKLRLIQNDYCDLCMAEVKGGSPLTVAGLLDRAEPITALVAPPPGALEPHRPRCFVVAAAPEDLCLWCQSVQSLRILRDAGAVQVSSLECARPRSGSSGFYRVFMYFLYCYYNMFLFTESRVRRFLQQVSFLKCVRVHISTLRTDAGVHAQGQASVLLVSGCQCFRWACCGNSHI